MVSPTLKILNHGAAARGEYCNHKLASKIVETPSSGVCRVSTCVKCGYRQEQHWPAVKRDTHASAYDG